MAVNAKVLDFSNVKEASGINPVRKTPGDYRATIVSVEDHESKGGNASWLFVFNLEGSRSAAYPYYCQLDEKALWKVRNLLLAAGLSVPKARAKVNPEKIVGKTVGISLDDEEYEGKLKSVITAVFPASEVEQTAPATRGAASVDADDDADADVEETTEDDMEELDIDEV